MFYKITFIALVTSCLFFNAFAQNDEWILKTPFPGAARHHPVGFGIGDTGYVLTGSDHIYLYSDFYKYDAANDTWESLGTFPGGARSFSIGIAYEGKGYIGFGLGTTSYLNDLWEYDPKTGNWKELATCPCIGRRHPALEAVNGKLYVGLGDGSTGNLNDWWEYDIETDTWSQKDDLPGPVRHHPFHFSIDSSVYAGMGHGFSIYDDWYRFDQRDSSWTALSSFPGGGRVAGTQFAHGGKGYVLSGDGANHSYMETGEFWKYDPETDTWEELTPHPGESLWAPSSFVVKDSLYMIGGMSRKNNDTLFSTLWKYTLPGTQETNTALESVKTDGSVKLNIYPNPADDQVSLPPQLELSEVRIFNTLGQKTAQYRNTNRVDVSELESGIYFIKAQDEKGNHYHSKFMKK